MQRYLGILGAVVAVMFIFFAYAARELVLIHEEIASLRRDVGRVDVRLDRVRPRPEPLVDEEPAAP